MKIEDDKVEDWFESTDAFDEMFEEAQENARSDSATKFLDELERKYADFGMATYMSEAQYGWLKRLASGETH